MSISEFIQQHQDVLTTGTVQGMADDFGIDFDVLVASVRS